MRDYYEELWRSLPAERTTPDWELRSGFLRAAVQKGDRTLDLGCGDGAFIEALVQAGAEVVGADVAQSALERARARHPGVNFRLLEIDDPLPFRDCQFDVVWASEVIEHIGDTARWLSEVRRVLTPGGRLLLTTPSHGRLRLLLRGVEPFSEPLGDHLHLYTRASLQALLWGFGFDHVHIRTAAGPPLLRRLLLAAAVR